MVRYDHKELIKSFPKLKLSEIARELAIDEGYKYVVSFRQISNRCRSIGCCRNERELIALIQHPDTGRFKTLYERSRLLQEA